MLNIPIPPDVTRRHGGLFTYLVLALTGALLLSLAATPLLAAVGVIGPNSQQGWATMIGMWLALPIAVSLLAAAILSLVGLVRGPRVIRLRLAAWWVVSVGGSALSQALASMPGFNPYLGTPQPIFGVSDALLAVCLSLSVFLPCRWFLLAASGRGAS
jgi:hypothetical protein